MCPVGNEHPQKLLEMRRFLTMDAEDSLPETGALYRNLENQSNPWGLSRAERGSHLAELGVKNVAEVDEFEYLLWVGCSGSYDDRAQKTAVAFAKLLQKAEVSFAILGEMEGCCGDPARRLGNEEMFFSQALENIETMKEVGVKKILTTCPHGFHTIKFEYPQYGGNFEVEHYSTFLAKLVEQGKLQISKKAFDKITYHDSCYLGRYHDIYNEPRKLVSRACKQMTEMSESHAFSFCCGGGGGRMFLEENTDERVNQARTDMAKETGADTVAVACPFCTTMIEDGIKERGYEENLKTRDLAEILIECIEESE
ncbi:MAG: (Fe-S)-binding protein [Planctomycetota bacterium]|nr:(Fe-S)-binding protein [Planctomycetota bacterium]